MSINKTYKFIIDTDSNVIPIEYRLGAYLTGNIMNLDLGYDNNGGKEAISFINECGKEKFYEINDIMNRCQHSIDESRGYSYSDIISNKNSSITPNTFSFVLFLKEKPTKDQVAFLKERANKFFEFDGIRGIRSIESFSLLETKTRTIITEKQTVI